MIDSYNLVTSTWQLLDGGANLIDTFYLPDTYIQTPAIGATSGVVLSEDNDRHRRYISLAEIVAMGLTDVAGLTSQFNTDKATVAGANTNLFNTTFTNNAGTYAHTIGGDGIAGTFSIIGDDGDNDSYRYGVQVANSGTASSIQIKAFEDDEAGQLTMIGQNTTLRSIGGTLRLGHAVANEDYNGANIAFDNAGDGSILVHGHYNAAESNNAFIQVGDTTASGNSTSLTVDDETGDIVAASTTGAFRVPVMTGAQATALGVGSPGDQVYVTSTDGVFVSVGFWGQIAGTWTALH